MIDFKKARLDIVDRSYTVIMRGSTPFDLMPVEDEGLELELVAEIEPMLGQLGSEKHRVLCGLLGNAYAWRVMPIADSEYVGVICERNDIGARAARFARRRAIGENDAALLRLTVGGYTTQELSRRLRKSPRRIAAEQVTLARRLGFADLTSFVLGVASETEETLELVSAAS